MLEFDLTWTSTGSSGGLTPIQLHWPACEQVVFYAQFSTLASTQSYSLHSAQDSTGPCVIEASTSISTAASTAQVLRLTGPLNHWVRPYLHSASTGDYKFRLTGAS